eukprot:1678308-Amphidinium_carterae.1
MRMLAPMFNPDCTQEEIMAVMKRAYSVIFGKHKCTKLFEEKPFQLLSGNQKWYKTEEKRTTTTNWTRDKL